MKKSVVIPLSGHSDKVCDQIADAIVDEYLRRDPMSRVHVTVLGSHGMAMIGGEVQSSADFDVSALARAVYKDIGYEDDIEVFANMEQTELFPPRGTSATPVIVQGYATAETRERLPRPLVHARTFAAHLETLRLSELAYAWMRPDGMLGVTCENGAVSSVALHVSHREAISVNDVRTAMLEQVHLVFGEGTAVSVNATGIYTKDGWHARAGGSGRQAASDTYGGFVPHGDVGLSGRDPFDPARAGTYAARAAARMLVDMGLVQAAQVTVAYEPGRVEPAFIRATGAGIKARGVSMDMTDVVKNEFDFRIEAIVERLKLQRPMYRACSASGQVGGVGQAWEVIKDRG